MGSGACHLFFRQADAGTSESRRPVRSADEGPAAALLKWFGDLSFEDAVCWGFGVVEGDLDGIFWTLARREIQQKLQLKLGEESAKILSQHNSLVSIMNAALGDGKSRGPITPHQPGVRNLAEGHTDVESAVAAINAALTI